MLGSPNMFPFLPTDNDPSDPTRETAPKPAVKSGSKSATRRESRRPRRPFRPWIAVVLPLMLAGLGGFFALHADYYIAPLREQVEHPDHERLRSSRGLGLVFGLAGATLVVLNLSYLVRRRFARRRILGSLRAWMDLHVTTGLVAAGCIVLHSALGLRSSMGSMAAFSFFIVVVTGLIGRYLYAQVPRSIEGRELRLAEVRDEYAALLAELERLGVTTAFEARPKTMPYGSTLRTFFAVLTGSGELRRQFRAARRDLVASGVDDRVRREAVPVLRRLVRERVWMQRYEDLRRLMASWRFLHRWLALVMIGAVAVHVVTAVLFANLSLRAGG